MGQEFSWEEAEAAGEIDVAELQEWYKKFVMECPSGTLFMHEFKRFFKVTDDEEASQYVEGMFRAFDKNGVRHPEGKERWPVHLVPSSTSVLRESSQFPTPALSLLFFPFHLSLPFLCHSPNPSVSSFVPFHLICLSFPPSVSQLSADAPCVLFLRAEGGLADSPGPLFVYFWPRLCSQ